MTTPELIKAKISEVVQLQLSFDKREKSYRTRIREVLFEIENMGGWVALGYKNAMSFYSSEFSHKSAQQVSEQVAAKDYELLIGVPLGTYGHWELVGLKFGLSANSRGRLLCSLKNAQKVKDTWKQIVKGSLIERFCFLKFTSAQFLPLYFYLMIALPSADEIYRFSKTTRQKASSGYQRLKEKALLSEAKTIPLKVRVKIAQLEQEVLTLKNELELERSQEISFHARNRLTELREENDLLKKRIKDLESHSPVTVNG